MSWVISDLKVSERSIFSFKCKQNNRMHQFCSFWFHWQKYLLLLRLIFNIIFSWNVIQWFWRYVDKTLLHLYWVTSNFLWTFDNCILTQSVQLCSASTLPYGAAGVSEGRWWFQHTPNSHYGWWQLSSFSITAGSLLVSRLIYHLMNSFGSIFSAHRWWQEIRVWGELLWGHSSVLVLLALCCKEIMTDASLRHLAQDLERKEFHLANASSWKSCCRIAEKVTLRDLFTWHKVAPWEFP